MDSINNSAFYASLAIPLLSVAYIALLSFMLNDIFQSIKRRKCKETIKKSINAGIMKNEDIYLLAERWGVKREKISSVLNLILSDYLNEKDCPDEPLGKIRNLIVWHQENDPFADLPENIKLQLLHLQKKTDTDHAGILQLSKSLNEIYLSNQRKAKREQRISIVSLLIGLIGLFYGFIK
ncbi:hypothetical protein AB6D34_18310 [Pectobacterium brasiliense]|uniref:Uncharacterized protein n=1 Tax=Pectobacterium brasiliense TaxID=180957 RepID=A0A3S0XXS5_9GAMM|nr:MULTISPECIES: hypothetical protein [Pectobacterium]GKW29471.1 hypothetical protein PEC331060_26490 [Pectobacterium carotovorum subsp. carotovorum]MBN3048101.1 hypothetical protein [Pectobacterium brasiliense]MBN3057076.1 hypothetical protein [Pectobacterium brasiliense]MBN3077612.1 hypothetical protein [Pectobacterium brasiliense]MBN3082033.1 hypothetical protein [Pectobacterium polaris]